MACQSLGHNIIALEQDMKDFLEVLKPFIVVDMLDLIFDHIRNFDIVSSVKKHSNLKMLDCE
jgi:hypothetical protein